MNVYRHIKPGSLVFDVGANIGEKTDIFLSYGYSVVCFEPQEDLAEQLRLKYENKKNAQVSSLALGTGGPIPFYKCNANKISTCSPKWITESRFAGRYSWNEKIEIQSISLDMAIRFYGKPYYIKIDVEGYEGEVISGLTQKVPIVSFEYTKELFEDAKICIDKLSRIGFSKFNFTVGEFDQFVFPTWKSKEVLMPFIEGMNEPTLWGDLYAI